MSEQQPFIDLYSPTWHTLKKWAEAELVKAREKNDSLKIDHDKTTALRGRIKVLKEILAMPEKIKETIEKI